MPDVGSLHNRALHKPWDWFINSSTIISVIITITRVLITYKRNIVSVRTPGLSLSISAYYGICRNSWTLIYLSDISHKSAAPLSTRNAETEHAQTHPNMCTYTGYTLTLFGVLMNCQQETHYTIILLSIRKLENMFFSIKQTKHSQSLSAHASILLYIVLLLSIESFTYNLWPASSIWSVWRAIVV